MIQANELRIGNWVAIGGVIESPLTKINPELCTAYEPIALTPYILNKCGFKLCETEECLKYGVVYQLYPFTAIQNSTGVFCFKYLDRWIRNITPNYPESIHQLQNLYFELTRIELNINF